MMNKSMEIKSFKSKTGAASTETTTGRTVHRRAVLWPAQVVVNGHSFDCQIRNLSLGGAKIKLSLPLKEGTIVKLVISEHRISFSAEVVWQAGELIGLIFQDSPSIVRRALGPQADTLGLADSIEQF